MSSRAALEELPSVCSGGRRKRRVSVPVESVGPAWWSGDRSLIFPTIDMFQALNLVLLRLHHIKNLCRFHDKFVPIFFSSLKFPEFAIYVSFSCITLHAEKWWSGARALIFPTVDMFQALNLVLLQLHNNNNRICCHDKFVHIFFSPLNSQF